ncbi:hypothetical protein PoB_004842100 [Plakobranchus ocellatus]|uniref:Uncharacterized protein n=1 Tax=Plakobranchus ocellatus TaxID=259542 RepID=A0AAV4BS77_9GAST|nr:hypothetical protein PoB_004842100 [Plakobranchus ocellatus]
MSTSAPAVPIAPAAKHSEHLLVFWGFFFVSSDLPLSSSQIIAKLTCTAYRFFCLLGVILSVALSRPFICVATTNYPRIRCMFSRSLPPSFSTADVRFLLSLLSCQEAVGAAFRPQQGELKFSGPPSGQKISGGAQTLDRKGSWRLRADAIATVSPTPLILRPQRPPFIFIPARLTRRTTCTRIQNRNLWSYNPMFYRLGLCASYEFLLRSNVCQVSLEKTAKLSM